MLIAYISRASCCYIFPVPHVKSLSPSCIFLLQIFFCIRFLCIPFHNNVIGEPIHQKSIIEPIMKSLRSVLCKIFDDDYELYTKLY